MYVERSKPDFDSLGAILELPRDSLGAILDTLGMILDALMPICTATKTHPNNPGPAECAKRLNNNDDNDYYNDTYYHYYHDYHYYYYHDYQFYPYSNWRKRIRGCPKGRADLAGPSEPRSTHVASTVAPRGSFDRPSRPQSARAGFFDRHFRPKWREKGAEERFWSLLGRFGVPRRVDFGGIFVIFRCDLA